VDDVQVENIVLGQNGLLQDTRRGSVLLIHSTVMPATVHKLARAAGQRGIEVLDAPVSGGEDGARERQLCYMVGGETQNVERCRPVMEASAAHIFHMGGLGSGATAKMILQVVVCINMLGAQEAELLAQKSGLDFAALQKVLHVSSGQSFVCDHWLDRFKRPQ